MRWATIAAHQGLQLRKGCNSEGAVAWPLGAGVSQQMQLLQIIVALQAAHAREGCCVDEVGGEVQLLQALALLEVLHLGDIVQRQVEVPELLQRQRSRGWKDTVSQRYKMETGDVVLDWIFCAGFYL